MTVDADDYIDLTQTIINYAIILFFSLDQMERTKSKRF